MLVYESKHHPEWVRAYKDLLADMEEDYEDYLDSLENDINDDIIEKEDIELKNLCKKNYFPNML